MSKRKLTKEEKRLKKERNAAFMIIFINGRQKRVRRPQQIDGMSVDEFIARNADPIWLHQNEMWELMPHDANAEAADDLTSLSPSQESNLPVSD
ncbi:MAG: hypothetical protein WCH39_08155 [Schlesneria sp.]